MNDHRLYLSNGEEGVAPSEAEDEEDGEVEDEEAGAERQPRVGLPHHRVGRRHEQQTGAASQQNLRAVKGLTDFVTHHGRQSND